MSFNAIVGQAGSGKSWYMLHKAVQTYFGGQPILFINLQDSPSHEFRKRYLRSVSSLVFNPEKTFEDFMSDISEGIPVNIAKQYFKDRSKLKSEYFVTVNATKQLQEPERLVQVIKQPRYEDKGLKPVVFIDGVCALGNPNSDIRVKSNNFVYFKEALQGYDVWLTCNSLTKKVPDFLNVVCDFVEEIPNVKYK